MPKVTGFKALLPFYLQGREDASEGCDLEELDIDFQAIALSVTSLDDVRARALDAAGIQISEIVEAEKADWVADNKSAIHRSGADERDAYAAWGKGYRDEVAQMIETELVNTLAEEDTAVETPTGKRSARENPANVGGTYADWYQTGIQDCQNAFDATDLADQIDTAVAAFQKHRQDISKLAAEAVKDYWAEIATESKAEWLEQHEVEVREDGLKPDRAYEFWADGWRSQAQRYVAEKIVEQAD